MNVRAALTDLNGHARAFLDGYTRLVITPRINGFAEVSVELPRGLGLGSELSVGRRAVQVFDGSTPLFFGKVWQPLSLSSGGHKIVARDSLAEFVERRVRAKAEYTATNNAGGPWDAAEIMYDRLAAQNAKRNTYLREGTADASVNRVRTVLPGALEKDLLEELANAADGFFYQAVPVVGVPGVMADLDILYPDAGVTRDKVLFAYGDGTVDTLDDYEVVEYLPMNRAVAAASASTGGRIAEAAEDTDSIAEYGLFEEEVTFSDVTDTTLLAQHAQARVKATPPRTISATPSINAPLLFTDFSVGDFVRLQIVDDGLDMLVWTRVLDATLEIGSEGNPRLTGISFEILVGDTLLVPPHRLFRTQLDDTRRRLEALERRQQNVTQTAAASPGEPTAGGGSGGGGTPSEPTPAPAPPPSTPPEPPTIGVSAVGMNVRSGGVLYQGVEVSVSVDMKGLPGDVVVDVGGAVAVLSGSGTVFLNKGPGSYSVNATVRTTAGTAAASTSATVPAFTAE